MFFEQNEMPRILVVDPDASLKNQLNKVLNSENADVPAHTEQSDFALLGCSSYFQAVECLQQSTQALSPFALVFVELDLSDGKSGLSLISELWKIDADLEIIICSAHKSLSWDLIMEHVGQSDQLLYIKKPAVDLELRQAVHAMVRKWQLSKQSQNIMIYLEHQIKIRTQEIAEANKKLIQADKLASVGQLAAGIAHEINTPSQYISDNIEAIKDYTADLSQFVEFNRKAIQEIDPEAAQKVKMQEERLDIDYILRDMPLAISQSQEGIQQISSIVKAMKGFSHMGHGSATHFDINAALKNTLIIAKNNYKYIAEVTTDFAPTVAVEGYPELNQVFLNLITNAAHAIEENQQGRGVINISTREQNDHAVITICDNGIGIADEIKGRIFDPFFTTKEVGKGTGQGLHIAYQIIHDQHGGELTFETALGKGTCFFVTLPKTILLKNSEKENDSF